MLCTFRLIRQAKSDGFSDDEDEAVTDKGEFGPSAHRYVNSDEESEDDDEDAAEQTEGKDGHKFTAVWGMTLDESRRRAADKGEEEEDSSSSDESDEFEGMDEVGGDLLDDDIAKNTGRCQR